MRASSALILRGVLILLGRFWIRFANGSKSFALSKRPWKILSADLFAAGVERFDAAIFPLAGAIEGGEAEIGRCAALAADEFRATADVIHQPRGHEQVEWVALHFFDVK